MLFMVWVPTTTYQLALIFSGGQSDFFLLYDVLLLMLSLQVRMLGSGSFIGEYIMS